MILASMNIIQVKFWNQGILFVFTALLLLSDLVFIENLEGPFAHHIWGNPFKSLASNAFRELNHQRNEIELS